MTHSRNASSSCFSGIARLLLCKGSLQTHPSDQIPEANTTEFDHAKKDPIPKSEAKAQAPPTPGVVARLMGLDSLPADTNWTPKERTPDSVTRSRSVNFMDYLLELDLNQTQHRRVRTSVSFREVPTLLNQQNHDFLVLYLDNAEKAKKVGHGEMKQKNEEKSKDKENIREGIAIKTEKNQRNNRKICKLRDEPRRVCSKQFSRFGSCKGAQVSSGFVSHSKKYAYRKSGVTSKAKVPVKPINQKEVLVESKFMKKMKNKQANKRVQSQWSSEDSSPVSVLGLDEFFVLDETPVSDDTEPMDLNSEKKSSPKATNLGHPSPHSIHVFNTNSLEPRAIKKYEHEPSENRGPEYYIELARNLCSLTAKDITESNWLGIEFVGFEEICMEFGQQILDLLLRQVAEEIVGLHVENFEVQRLKKVSDNV